MRKAVAVLLCISFCVLFFAACGGKDEPTTLFPGGEESTTADYTTGTDGDTVTDSDTTASGNDAETVTVKLVTEPGGTVPTVVTSQWNTTLPSTTAAPMTITETTMNFTVPGEQITRPTVMSSVVTTMPSSSSNATTGGNTPGSTGATSDSNTTKSPSGSAATTAPTTVKVTPKAMTLLYSMHSQSSDGIIIEFESSGWSGTIKKASTRVDIVVNGSQRYASVKCSVLSGYNQDNRIEVTLQTNDLELKSGDSIMFSLPEGVIRTADGAFYNLAYSTSVIY